MGKREDRRPLRPATEIEAWPGFMVKPSELIEVFYPATLTLYDRRVFNELVCNAWDRIDVLGADHEIRIQDLKKGMTGRNDRVRSTIRRLMATVISVPWTSRKGKLVWRQVQLLGGNDVEASETRGVLVYSFDPRLISIIKCSTIWGQLELSTIRSFRSKYSLALFEWFSLRLRRFKKTEIITVDALRLLMGVQEDRLIRWSNFEQKALTPALDEINGLSQEFRVHTPKLIKTGRKVTAVEFAWRRVYDEEKEEASIEMAKSIRKRRDRVTGKTKKARLLFAGRVEGLKATLPTPQHHQLNDEIPH